MQIIPTEVFTTNSYLLKEGVSRKKPLNLTF